MTQARLDTNFDLEADSWAFALRVYGRPLVADACLRLQDEAGVDVMMFLITAFAAVRHHVLLTTSEIRDLGEACRPWREQIVQPLRAIRRRLKSGPLPAPSGAAEPFRSTIKAAELAAERLQNQLLAERLPLTPPERDSVTPQGLRSVLSNVVTLALAGCGSEQPSDLQALIDVVVDAAMQDARQTSGAQ
jgi:uncharacterized protein (TIGR02444 family)